MLFDCALIFYVDKFGEQEIDKVIEKLFVWAYSKRLCMLAIYLVTIDIYALKDTNVFKIIRDANSYKEVLNIQLKDLTSDFKNIKIDEDIKNKILGYFNVK